MQDFCTDLRRWRPPQTRLLPAFLLAMLAVFGMVVGPTSLAVAQNGPLQLVPTPPATVGPAPVVTIQPNPSAATPPPPSSATPAAPATPAPPAPGARIEAAPTRAPAAGASAPQLQLPPLNDATPGTASGAASGVPLPPRPPPAPPAPATLSIQPIAGSAAPGALPIPPRRPAQALGPDLTAPVTPTDNFGTVPALGLAPEVTRGNEMAALIQRLDNQLRYAQSGQIVGVAGFAVEVMIGRTVLQPDRSVCREVTVVTPPVDAAWACQRADGSWYHAQAR